MPQKKIHPSEADLYNSASEILRWKEALEFVSPIPKGWRTREELQSLLNLGKSQTVIRLKEGVKKGKVEVKSFYTIENDKRVKRPYYFLK
jgi:hypothetical protein